MNDTISKDPYLQEEARRAAKEAAAPKPTFDMKAIAQEEFDRIIDKSIVIDSFELFWKAMTTPLVPVPTDLRLSRKVLGTFTEVEFRALMQASWHSANAFYLELRAKDMMNKAQKMIDAARYTIQFRLQGNTSEPMEIDYVSGEVYCMNPTDVSAAVTKALTDLLLGLTKK